ncbi:hypothetical protein BKP45_06620 [Anaerobacillus alkalidiazotrophicus]|uniref:Uncharacterized protein n=1 Tax=Anaerobacillus alkalidiazotrophicus TaxID=472963 RepID=A0A1S2MEM4_9BACI|nr:hypothetical protein [Anaerobacillus alkalidiazotrophicus]OIJ22307.1 hypothetical protein BKP45_06620 [Anaerobacillus alkalidiazotrophicus]
MKRNRLLFLALASSVLVILIAFFQWNLIDIITEFLMIPIWLVVFGFFIVITIMTVMNLFKNKDWKPLAIQLITIIIWLFFPFTEVMLDLDFKMNKLEREEVVELVINGTLKPNVPNNPSAILLPEKYEKLSKGGGQIFIEKKNKQYSVLFFTHRGVLDGFSGFIYSPEDRKPNQDDFNGDIKEIKKLDKNWYFVVSY